MSRPKLDPRKTGLVAIEVMWERVLKIIFTFTKYAIKLANK